MITVSMIELLIDLNSTNSAKDKLTVIEKFNRDDSINNLDTAQATCEDIKKLFECYEQAVSTQSINGYKALAAREMKRVKVHEFPKFMLHCKGKGKCSGCNIDLNGNVSIYGIPSFLHRFGKKKLEICMYCPNPACFPIEFKENMLNDIDYKCFVGAR